MTLRAHLFLLLFLVATGGATLTFVNEQWHSVLEQRQIALGNESVVREKVRNISSSLQRFLVTYDLVVFSGISYLSDDALVQLVLLDDALSRIDAPAESTSSIKAIRSRLQTVRVVLQDVLSGGQDADLSEHTHAAEADLAWIVESVETLEGRIAQQFELHRNKLTHQMELQKSTQQSSLLAYGIFIFGISIWSSRRLARPVESLAQLSKHSIGDPIDAPELSGGPKEFRDIASRIFELTNSLEEAVADRTRALEGQVRDHMTTQESLTLSHAKLEKSIEELEAAQLALVTKERLSALGEMVGGISHDFNNVLVPIISYSSILLEDPDLEASERSELLTIVMTAAEDAARIVERLQAFNRSTDTADPNQEIDIDELVEDAVAMAEPRWRIQEDLDKGSIAVTTELGGVGTTTGNAPEIRQALINLIFNAVDALPNGGHICISTRREEDLIVLTVKDNGAGMSEETLASCQKPFFSTKSERGTGLGLAMVKNTAELHNGRLEIDSTLGKGTSIQMWLQSTTVETPGLHGYDTKAAADLGLRVLLVDDEVPVLNAHAAILRHLGYQVKSNAQPLEALAQLKAESFDLIITDLRMPEMSGVEFARRAHEIDPNPRIFLLTAYEGGLNDASQIPSISAILQKPMSAAKMSAAIGEFL